MACSRIAVSRCCGELDVDGDGAIDFAAFAHQAAERELDVRVLGLGGEPREDFGGAIEAIVDQVIEAGEIVDVAPHAPAARRARPSANAAAPTTRKHSRRTSGPMPRRRMRGR